MQKLARIFAVILFGVLCLGVTSIAEEIVLTTYYPAPYGVYDELTTTGNTYLAEDSGNVGIGTDEPIGKLEVRQSADTNEGGLVIKNLAGNATGRLWMDDATFHIQKGDLDDTHMVIDADGNVGIGTADPSQGKLTIETGASAELLTLTLGGSRQIALHTNGAGYAEIRTYNNNHLYLNPTGTGNVGIGVTDPGAYRLNVNGDFLCNRIDTAAASQAHGLGHNFNLDIAEDILAEDCEPGDVVVIDPDNNEKVIKSTRAFDKMVAGIISTDPAFHIGKHDEEGYLPLSLAGRVPCKVSIENGPIERGDLLTTSSTPGHAMKATDREKSFGAIMGKALEPFDGGPEGEERGAIVVLVTLQ